MSAYCGLQAFAPFQQLPPEIRNEIWAYTIPNDMSEVCLVPEPHCHNGFSLSPGSSPETGQKTCPMEMFFVFTAYPATMHVNRESRSIAMAGVQLMRCPESGCLVPFREYKPELDVLYLDARSYEARFSNPGYCHRTPLAPNARRLAAEVHFTFDFRYLGRNLIREFPNLKSLALIPCLSERGGVRHPSRPLDKRYRIRHLANPTGGSRVYPSASKEGPGSYLSAFLSEAQVPLLICSRLGLNSVAQNGGISGWLDVASEELHSSLRAGQEWGMTAKDYAKPVWDMRKGCFSFELSAQTLVEYQVAGDKKEWVTVCRGLTRLQECECTDAESFYQSLYVNWSLFDGACIS